MTDKDLIKELENELDIEIRTGGFWQAISFVPLLKERSYLAEYELNQDGNVYGLHIQNFQIPKIPKIILKFKSLEILSLCDCGVKEILPLTNLNKIKVLKLSDSDIPEKEFWEFVRKKDKPILLEIYGSFSYTIFPKYALNHNFPLIADGTIKDAQKVGIYMEDFDVYPPKPMLKLGYTNSKFYHDIYPEKRLENYKSDKKRPENQFPNKEQHLRHEKNNIINFCLQKYYQNKTIKEFPYSIRKISIEGFQGINDLLIENIALNADTNMINDPQWIFITGENGYGKTSFLQALVIGLYGNQDGNRILSKDASIYLEFKNGENYQVNAVDNQRPNFISFEQFAAYGPSRLNKNPRPYNDSKTNSIFSSYSELLDIEERMIAWEKDKNQNLYFKNAKSILLKLLSPYIVDIEIERQKADTFVNYVEIDTKLKKKFEELSSGYRSIIAMIGDIIIRLSKKQSLDKFSNLAGIVLIDELDLHLHPKWQKEIVLKLTELFPKVQFIVSTHSPIPLLGAPPNSVILNVKREENKGIIAQKLDIDFTRLLPNSILTSSIFDFDEIIANSKPKDKFPHTEDDYDKIVEKEKLQKKIAAFLGDKSVELLNLINTENDEENK